MQTDTYIDIEFQPDEEFPEGRAWPKDDATFHINGCPMHLFAIRVRYLRRSFVTEQIAWDPSFDEELEALVKLNGEALQAVTIEGLEGEWVFCAHPHSQ